MPIGQERSQSPRQVPVDHGSLILFLQIHLPAQFTFNCNQIHLSVIISFFPGGTSLLTCGFLMTCMYSSIIWIVHPCAVLTTGRVSLFITAHIPSSDPAHLRYEQDFPYYTFSSPFLVKYCWRYSENSLIPLSGYITHRGIPRLMPHMVKVCFVEDLVGALWQMYHNWFGEQGKWFSILFLPCIDC